MTVTTTAATTEPEVTPDPLPTVWRVPEELWAEVKAILDQHDPAKRLGRKRIDQRKALEGIIFRQLRASDLSTLTAAGYLRSGLGNVAEPMRRAGRR